MSSSSLLSLGSATQHELLANHGIDPGLFADWTIEIGPSIDYRNGLEAWANERNLHTSHGQIATRSNSNKLARKSVELAAGGWSINSVAVNHQGYPQSNIAFIGMRIHPSLRTPQTKIKFDTRGWDTSNRGLFLPPLSLDGAIELLGDHGFDPDATSYQPVHAWQFILQNPEVKIWIEESALKAMAACSIGQLAIGINGINGWGQKGRSDRLLPFLNRLAKKKRVIVVRFDSASKESSKSTIQAQMLARRLEKAGASNARWWSWPGSPGKTDDFVAGLIAGSIPCQQKQLLDCCVTGVEQRQAYTRIIKSWPGLTIEREFEPEDIAGIALQHRILCLKGATGTSKSKAMQGALELLEDSENTQYIVLGCYHRSSLVHKGAFEYGVVDMSSPPDSPERMGIYEERTVREGLFCCGESAVKTTGEKSLYEWFLELKENPRPTLLNLDEVSQVLANWTTGGTEALRRIRGKALQALEGLIQLDCVRVWAADSLIGDIELEWLQSVSGENPYLIQSTFTRARNLYMGMPNAENERALRLLLHSVARTHGRFWLGHGTVSALHRTLDALPAAVEGTELRITGEDASRHDPRVAKLMADTEGEGPQYQRVGFSPAMSCGISMAKTQVDLTAIVQEYCWHAEDVLQALNRARESLLRILLAPILVPDAAGPTKETVPNRASRAFEQRMRAGQLTDYALLIEQSHPATRRLIIQLEARRNLEAFNNHWVLLGMLKQEGYTIRDISELQIVDHSCVSTNPQRPLRQSCSFQGVKAYRMAALQRLSMGATTLIAEQSKAMKLVNGGTFIDLAEADVSEIWIVAQDLKLHTLTQAGVVHAGSLAVIAVWDALTSLDKEGAKRVARLLGGRSDRIPGPMDILDVRRIWPLVKAVGFTPVKVGETRREGKLWRIEPIPLTT